MADLFPALALGDVLDEENAVIIKAECESAVVKGQIVEWNTHTAGEIGSVSTAPANSKKIAGGAMKNGAAGEVIPICKVGLWKGKASGAITIGTKVVSGANGVLVASAALDAPASYTEAAMQAELDKTESRCGIAVQTFADGDEGLFFLSAPTE